MQFYNKTCDRVFGYAFERCLNHDDTMIVCREAFIDMYFDISDLRKAPSVEYWQRKQVDKTLRYLVRKDRLSLIHEKTSPTALRSTKRRSFGGVSIAPLTSIRGGWCLFPANPPSLPCWLIRLPPT